MAREAGWALILDPWTSTKSAARTWFSALSRCPTRACAAMWPVELDP